MGKEFENKVVLITGAAGGVGEETAKQFINKGAHVCITDINYEGVKNLERALNRRSFIYNR